MRFLIVASILAYAAAVPSGPLVGPYGIAPALPTISAGDINGAAIDAHVVASDHVRAAYDHTRQVHDKVNELHGQAVNNAEEHAWRVVDGVKTVEARLDGAAAAAAPIISKQLVGRVAPVNAPYSAPAIAHYSAPAIAPYSAQVIAPYSQVVAPYSAQVISPYSAVGPVYDAPYPIQNISPYYGAPLGYPQW